ncbi:MAG TPA: membrane dipeptidase [Longimicrobiales bacterium]|nr:membrane dipeptidase [Longimicrobiales bacterium]
MRLTVTTGMMLLGGLALASCAKAPEPIDEAVARDARIEQIHQSYVFVDTHAHPSRFHRANIEKIEPEELERYRRNKMDLLVANVSSDAAFHGGYTNRDGTEVTRLQGDEVHPTKPGDGMAFTLDRLDRIFKTVSDGDAVLADSPAAVLEAKRQGKIAVMAALEGVDGLEGSLDNLREVQRRGVRLVQLIHFLNNDVGHKQTEPFIDEGLTDFGREFIRESNRLGLIVDLAHANTPTIMDALEVSTQPMIFSHTGVKARHGGARDVTDEEIRAIAAKGGLIGIWPSASLGNMAEMVAHMDHVKNLVGIDYLSIGSDLRGMDYIPEFGEEANFLAIVDGLIAAGYTDEEIGKVMGGNFFRLWEQVAAAAAAQS